MSLLLTMYVDFNENSITVYSSCGILLWIGMEYIRNSIMKYCLLGHILQMISVLQHFLYGE